MKSFSKIWIVLALTLGSAVCPRDLKAQWEPLGPPGGEISHLLVHPKNPQVLWAGTPVYGVFKSLDGGASWNPSNQGLDRQGLQGLAVAPGNPQILYAAGGGKVYRSSDGGRTWKVALSCSGDDQHPCTLFVSSLQLVVHPSDARTVFAMTTGGVLKSSDGGVSWRLVRIGPGFIQTLVFEPGNPQILYAAGDGRLFKSKNGGASWKRVGERLQNISTRHLVIDPKKPLRMWMGGWVGDGVYRSLDGGVTWQRSRSGLDRFNASALALSPAVGAGFPTVWVGNEAGLFRSLDGGMTWQALQRGRHVAAIASHPGRPATLWIGTQRSGGHPVSGVYKSLNRGVTWSFSSRGILNLETYSLAFDPVAPGGLWTASGQGIQHSTDGGTTWTERSGDLPRNLFVTAVAADPHDPQIVWAGTSAGVFVTEDGGDTWEERREGLTIPGSFARVNSVWISPSDSATAYLESSSLALYKTVDRGRHWTLLPAPPAPSTLWSGDLWIDPRNPEVILAARGGLWSSRDGGASWAEISLGNGAFGFRTVAADPRNPDVLYVGGDQGLFRSADGGLLWQHIIGQPISRLTVGATGAAWIESNSRVHFSPDGLSGWTRLPNLTQFSGLSVLAADPHDPDTVYAGGHFVVSGNLVVGLFRHSGD